MLSRTDGIKFKKPTAHEDDHMSKRELRLSLHI